MPLLALYLLVFNGPVLGLLVLWLTWDSAVSGFVSWGAAVAGLLAGWGLLAVLMEVFD